MSAFVSRRIDIVNTADRAPRMFCVAIATKMWPARLN
jgi:hypothetical protein